MLASTEGNLDVMRQLLEQRAEVNQAYFGVRGVGFSKTPPATPYLGGQGDLVSRLIMGINGLTMWVIGVTNLLTKSP